MSLTWSQFNDEVRLFLHVYNDTENVQTLIDQLIVSGAADIQRTVESYRTGHVDVYTPGDVALEGFASTTTAPNGRITSARLVKYDLEENVLRPDVFRTLTQLDWSMFAAMRGGEVALGEGYIAVNPVGRKLAVTPALNSATRLLIAWDGVKTDFDATDVTPFDDRFAEAVSYYVLARVNRVVDRDLSQAQSYESEYVRIKRKLVSDKNWNNIIDERVASQLEGTETTTGGLFPWTPVSSLFVFRPDITSLTGGTATSLDGQATGTTYGEGAVFCIIVDATIQYWRLIAADTVTDVLQGYVRPADYAGLVWQHLP